jgi:hypothetical protein
MRITDSFEPALEIGWPFPRFFVEYRSLMLMRFIADDYQSFANILRIALIYIDNNEMVSWSNLYDRDLEIISTRRANCLTAMLFLRDYDAHHYDYICMFYALLTNSCSSHVNEDLQGLQIDHRPLNLFFYVAYKDNPS